MLLFSAFELAWEVSPLLPFGDLCERYFLALVYEILPRGQYPVRVGSSLFYVKDFHWPRDFADECWSWFLYLCHIFKGCLRTFFKQSNTEAKYLTSGVSLIFILAQFWFFRWCGLCQVKLYSSQLSAPASLLYNSCIAAWSPSIPRSPINFWHLFVQTCRYSNGIPIYVHCVLVLSGLASSALWCALGGLNASIRKVREVSTCVL